MVGNTSSMLALMDEPSIQPSQTTQRLCTLLSNWPRAAISAWLADQDFAHDTLTTQKTPDVKHKRQVPFRGFERPDSLEGGLRDNATKIVGIFDPTYPESLKAIPDPPLVLFYMGEITALRDHNVSVVGARKCSTIGNEVAFKMSQDLASLDCSITSGLAIGIDSAAHRGALAAKTGNTVAVLGGGFEYLYPAQNMKLAQSILARGGLLISEYPPSSQPRRHHFPERNRIISGLSQLILLVEAGDKSGSLITARLALEQGRDVCAVPGSVFSPVSAGCHRLIRQGAALVTTAAEVIEETGWSLRPLAQSAPEVSHVSANLDPVSLQVLTVISAQGQQLDEIAILTSLSPQQVSQTLMTLQLSGFVRQGTDGYIRVL